VRSEVALLALLGCDPIASGGSRGAIEALGMGLDVGESESACRCSLLTLGEEGDGEGVLQNHAAPGLTTLTRTLACLHCREKPAESMFIAALAAQ